MIETLIGLILFAVVAIACCAGSGDSPKSTGKKRNTPVRRNNVVYDDYDYCECPSCGAPYYDGYCEECRYPDVNQGWLGEEY